MPDESVRIEVNDLVHFTAEKNRRVGSTGDGGPTVRVFVMEGDNWVEALRFDLFEKRPHYHYNPQPGDLGEQYAIDRVLVGDDLPEWVESMLDEFLPAMLRHGGHDKAADSAVEEYRAVDHATSEVNRVIREAAVPA